MKEIKETDMTMQQEPIQENKMGVLPIRPLLLGMAWPAILSMTISALYNIVDSIFVAKLSEDALTAVSIVSPIQMLIIALSVGSGVGINSLIARHGQSAIQCKIWNGSYPPKQYAKPSIFHCYFLEL